MKFSIGFNPPVEDSNHADSSGNARAAEPVRSVVRVHFPERGMTLSYYNDAFDLKRGDIVYVEGKLEGLRGLVVEVSLSFKIKLSDYKRVIGLAETDISGQFYPAGSHFVTFDPATLPFCKAISWFRPPEGADEYICGSADTSFFLNDLSAMGISSDIAERGRDYYRRNKVSYISVDGVRGYAIVEGGHAYELEFEYLDGRIRNLTCTCFCSYPCKHEFAAILQLKETLERIEKDYSSKFKETGCFAAVSKAALFSFVIDGKDSGSISLS